MNKIIFDFYLKLHNKALQNCLFFPFFFSLAKKVEFELIKNATEPGKGGIRR